MDITPAKVLLLASTFPARPGDGTPEFVLDLARELAKYHRVRVLVPMIPGAETAETIDGVEVRRFRFFPSKYEDVADGAIFENIRAKKSRLAQVPPLLAMETLAIRRQIKEFAPDVIHAFWIIPQGLASWVVNRKIPTVLTTLGGDLYALANSALRPAMSKVVRSARAITVMNAQMGTMMAELGAREEDIRIEPMGADLSAIRPRTSNHNGPVRLLFVGRLVEKKGLTHLIRALAALPDDQRYPLTVIGDGPLRAELEAQAEAAQRERGVKITFAGTGSKEDLREAYASHDILVVPSVPAASGDQDGLPVVVLEALGAGMPIIASDLSGIDAVVLPERTGILVPPGDEPALGQAITALASDSERRTELSRAAVEVAQHYAVPAVGERYAAILSEVAHTGEDPVKGAHE